MLNKVKRTKTGTGLKTQARSVHVFLFYIIQFKMQFGNLNKNIYTAGGGKSCIIEGCENNSKRVGNKVSFNKWPKNRFLRQQWLENLKDHLPREKIFSTDSRVCGAHFHISGQKRKEDRIPHLFLHTKGKADIIIWYKSPVLLTFRWSRPTLGQAWSLRTVSPCYFSTLFCKECLYIFILHIKTTI